LIEFGHILDDTPSSCYNGSVSDGIEKMIR